MHTCFFAIVAVWFESGCSYHAAVVCFKWTFTCGDVWRSLDVVLSELCLLCVLRSIGPHSGT